MGKKNRLYAKKPPLSAVDKTIYAAIDVLAIVGVLLILMAVNRFSIGVGFAETDVVAVSVSSLAYCIPLCLTILVFAILIHTLFAKKNQPIFGNKKFKAKGFEPTQKVYPLFSREFRENLTYKEKRKLKISVAIVAGLLIVSVILFPIGLYKREVLDSDNNFRSYNSFNQITHSGNIEDADGMTLRIKRSASGKYTRNNYTLYMSFYFGDVRYVFSLYDFGDMSIEDTLEYMLKLKSYFSEDEITIKGDDYVNGLVWHEYLTDAEASLVYELFDVDKQP